MYQFRSKWRGKFRNPDVTHTVEQNKWLLMRSRANDHTSYNDLAYKPCQVAAKPVSNR